MATTGKGKASDRAGSAAIQWRKEKPDWDLLPMELLGRINECHRVVRDAHLDPLFKRFNLQSGEFDVLATLRRAGRKEDGSFSLTPSQMYDEVMISSGGMTNRLDRLEKQELIARAPNPDDRRGTIVALTAKGLALIEKAAEAHLANEARILSGLGKEEQLQLNTLVCKLLKSLETLDPPTD